MRGSKAFLFACLLSPGAILAQPYGWVFGSSQDNVESGNRVAVVDLSDTTIVGGTPFAEGFLFTDEPGGADPLVPTFSPDGSVIYMLVGGDFDDSPPDGHLYVYPTATVIDKLGQGIAPTMADMLQPKIVLEVPNGENSPLEPVGQALTADGTKLVMTEVGYDDLYVWTVNPDGTIDESSERKIDLPADPGPPWINNAGTRLYLTTQFVKEGSRIAADTPPQIHVFDLTQDPPALMTTLDVPAPAQGAGLFGITTFAFATCAFTQAAGTNYTAFQPPGTQHADDSVLYIYSGYVGFTGEFTINLPPLPPQTQQFTLSDPFRVYALDTATNTFTTDGNPLYDEVDLPLESGQVVFSPLIHRFVNDNNQQPYMHVGGSYFIDSEGNAQALKSDNQDLMLSFGMLPPANDSFFIGSIAAIDGNEYAASGDLGFVNVDAKLYKYTPPLTGKGTIETLSPVHTSDRALLLPLGFAENKVVFGASDGLFVVPVGLDQDASVARDTIIGTYDYTTQGAIEVELDIVAGSYGQQPAGGGPAPTATPTPTATVVPTETATITATETVAPTGTPTATGTATPSPSQTIAPTLTDTPTATPTIAPTATETILPTLTIAPSPTATVAPSISPTESETPTPAPSPTETEVPTPTETPTPIDEIVNRLLTGGDPLDLNFDLVFDSADAVLPLLP